MTSMTTRAHIHTYTPPGPDTAGQGSGAVPALKSQSAEGLLGAEAALAGGARKMFIS